jgi:hypothetical protein
MAELKEAGIFEILAPKGVDGYGMGLETYVEVVRRLALGCPSTAWNVGHLIEHVWMLARWPQAAQDEVFAAARPLWPLPPARRPVPPKRCPEASASPAAGASPQVYCTHSGHCWL